MIENPNPFGVCFALMKIKYQTYDDAITKLDFLQPTDKVNCFINVETVLKYLSMTKDLEKKIIGFRRFPEEMKAEFINLAAHYKEFFRGNKLDCNIFLYMTDLNSESEGFQESKYNDEFRSYYLNKYNSNPRFALLGDQLKEDIFPDVQTICQFIPNVYFISTKNVDGGLIPYIISTKYPNYKNLIVSGDVHDTQYSYESTFSDHLYLRGYNTNILAGTTKEYLCAISKTDSLDDNFVRLFQNSSFYRTLLSCIGDRYRSIEGIRGIKLAKVIRILNSALTDGKITPDVHNASLLADLFPSDVSEAIYKNLLTVDIHNEYEMLGEGQIKSVLSQIVDRSDITALQQINRSRFNNKLWLESLLK